MGFVPFNCAPQAFFKGHLGAEAEKAFSSGGVEGTAWLPVGFAGIPNDFALEAGQPGNQFR